MDHEASQDVPLPYEVVAEIRSMHEGEDRGYHAWSHPLDMLRTMATIPSPLRDHLAFVCSTITHDAIYDPRRTDNEELSAQFAERRLAGLIPPETLARTARMNRATARHRPQDGLSPDDLFDTMHFLDLDLSILGAAEDRFSRYEAGVRHEYRHVEWRTFAMRRADILEGFLRRDAIYLTDWGRRSFEEAARINIARSIETLRMAA